MEQPKQDPKIVVTGQRPFTQHERMLYELSKKLDQKYLSKPQYSDKKISS